MKFRLQYYLTIIFFVGLFFIDPNITNASLTSAKDTLSNSRLSVMSQVSTSYSAGVNSINIGAGQSDTDTQNIFENDNICFADSGLNGCKGNINYSIASIPTYNGTTLEIAPALATVLDDTDIVVSTQSAIHTITFTTANSVTTPTIEVRIPAKTQTIKSNNNFPDFGSTTAAGTSGFDLGGVVAADITCSGGGVTWLTPIVTSSVSTGGNYHSIKCVATNGNVLDASQVITITIGNTHKLINPAPITSGHTRGYSDVYGVSVYENDSDGNLVDSAILAVGPVEGVLVSAVVPQALIFSIAGVSGTQCGKASTITATATTVPFGQTLAQVQNAHHSLTITTNSAGGYAVGVLEDGPLSIDGLGVTTIPDTTCPSNSCSNSGGTITPADWTSTTASGFGFSLSGSDAVFKYNDLGRAFNAAPFATTVANIMSNSGPVTSSVVYVCYQLAVSGNQAAGSYLSKLTYIATPKF